MAGAYLVATIRTAKGLTPTVINVRIYSENYQSLTRTGGDYAYASLHEFRDKEMSYEECEKALLKYLGKAPGWEWIRPWVKAVPLTVELNYTDPDRFDGVG